MSKAFVREDDVTDDPLPLPTFPVVPPGVPNYLTSAGAQRLHGELEQLQEKRSRLSNLSSDPAARREALGLDHRCRHVQQSLSTAQVIAPDSEVTDVVRFGATVTVRDNRGVETRYRIVGVDEADLDRGDVSWLSPIARALLNARRGDVVRFKAPRGWEELKIVELSHT